MQRMYFDLIIALLQKTIDDFTCREGFQRDYPYCHLEEGLCQVEHHLVGACLPEVDLLVAYLMVDHLHLVMGRLDEHLVAYHLEAYRLDSSLVVASLRLMVLHLEVSFTVQCLACLVDRLHLRHILVDHHHRILHHHLRIRHRRLHDRLRRLLSD